MEPEQGAFPKAVVSSVGWWDTAEGEVFHRAELGCWSTARVCPVPHAVLGAGAVSAWELSASQSCAGTFQQQSAKVSTCKAS